MLPIRFRGARFLATVCIVIGSMVATTGVANADLTALVGVAGPLTTSAIACKTPIKQGLQNIFSPDSSSTDSASNTAASTTPQDTNDGSLDSSPIPGGQQFDLGG